MLHMPLKLKWGKKSGRYDLSQDIYVLTVYLGDYAILQCTLTTESTASQCMEYLSQKVDLNQVEMFGLRYQMKTNDPDNRMMRWVELDKPLRRQLEKWACKPRQVQLAVLYHTPNAFTLTDQMARSYYFFLMKLDVVEGKLTVALEKYINLAAYSLQVEYGDFDPTIHTIDFMQTVPLLPKHICRSAQIQEDLLKRVSAVHERLKGMQPSYAALLYIVDAQQCEGYGEEYFNGKDEDSTEVKIGYSQEGIIIKGSYGAPLKHNHSRMYKSNLLIFGWEHIKDMHAMKRHLNIRLHDGTLVQFTMEDAEMARYVAMVMMWQFRYATNKAIIEKNSPMNINNLQGSIRTFNQMRSSNAELNSTRLIGPDYASLVYTMMPEPTYCSSTQRLPSTKRSKRTSLLQATSMCNLSIHTGCNETQSSKCSPLTSLQQYNKLENGIADASSLSQKQSKMELENVSRNVLSKSTAALNFKNDEEYSSSPGLLYCSTPFLLQNNAQNASSSPENINNMITSITDNDTPKLEFRNFAVLRKRHLADTMTGSSPEIRMTGGTHTLGRSAAALVHKHSLLANGSQKISPGHALSSPDLLSTCRSSPDLITSILDRYRLAVAEAELAATATAAATSQKPSHLQHLNGTIQNGIHWQTTKAYGNYVLPSPPPITTTSQTSMNEECQRIEDTATLATKFMVMDVAKAEARKHISKDAAIRPKMCKESLPLISPPFQVSSYRRPGASKVKSQAQPISYLAQAGHIYYPPSSPLAQTHRIYRQQNGFGSPSEPNLGATYTSNALKLPPLFSANHRYEVIEEDRTPESFVRRVHELCTPCSASKALQIRNSALVISSPRSISSPDVFNNRTKNQISEQLSTSSADSTQSPTIRPVLLNGNDSENIQSPTITNESSVCIVCDKATNICEADFMQNEESLANREHNLNESIEEVSQPSSLRHVMLNGVLQQDVINSHGHFIDLLGVVSMNDHGLSIPTNDQTLKRLMAKLVADDVLDEEFAVIPNRRISASVSTSQKPENMKRNRTRSIVPYEDTRIILHSKQSNPTGYINASNIQIPVGGQILKYILTQAPLPDTIEDFWQMVWESGSQLIVMLSDAQNPKSTTIPIYWPQKVMDKLRLSDYSLTLLSSTASKHQVTMMFQLKHDTSGERRIIYHLRLMDWESGKIPPNEESFLGFMDAVNSVRRYLENEQLKEVNSEKAGFRKKKSNNHLNLTDPTNRNRTQLTDFGYYNWCKKGLNIVNYALHYSPSSHSDTSSSEFSSIKKNRAMVDVDTLPTVIHCLTGAHESGVYLLVELMIHCIEHNMCVDIGKTLAMLRQQRMCLVKNVEQYRFVYSILINYLQKSRLI
ncbi:Tyrosine-protein phosphatase non-receptor type [Dirofilaria immitis]